MVVFLPKELQFLMKGLRKTSAKMRKIADRNIICYFASEDADEYLHLNSREIAYFSTYSRQPNRALVRKFFLSFAVEKFFTAKAEKEILESFETLSDAKKELQRYVKEFATEKDYNYYAYGNCRVYYEDLRNFFAEGGYEKLPLSDCKVERMYKKYIRRAINKILSKDRQ